MCSLFYDTKTKLAICISVMLNCVFSSICQRETYIRNVACHTSVTDILSYQFNTYSYLYLLFLPIFIYVMHSFLKTSKIDELTITKYPTRLTYFLRREKISFILTVMYRAMEIAVSIIVFTFSSLINSIEKFMVCSFSLPIQEYLCILPQTSEETLIITIYIQLILTIHYFFFAQIILLSDYNLKVPFFSVMIPVTVNFLFLALIKSDYLFFGFSVLHLLPHRNTFLEYIFDSRQCNYSLNILFHTLIYWICVLLIMVGIVFLKTKFKDFIYPNENTDRTIER